MLRRKESRAQELQDLMLLKQREQEVNDSTDRSHDDSKPSVIDLELKRQRSKEKDGKCCLYFYVSLQFYFFLSHKLPNE